MKELRRFSLLTLLVLVLSGTSFAQQARTAEEEAAYTKTINQRAGKIVKKMNIADESKADRVQAIIADQYRNLSTIHDTHDAKVKSIKEQAGLAEDKKAKELDAIEKKATKQLDKLHKKYISKLSSELTPAQVDEVKDGMTYGVLPLTYNGYLDMLPDLTEEQKKQIMDYLVEARERAMDAGSSEKKHWWFGKYKGKINNYLSAAGYNMKKASEDWHKRRKAAEAKS